jgi:hypothetical protein
LTEIQRDTTGTVSRFALGVALPKGAVTVSRHRRH